MTSSNRIIRSEQVTSEVVNWNAPMVQERARAAPAAEKTPAADPALLRERARQEGFEQGRAEGIAAGRAELAQRADVLQRVMEGMARPLQALEHQFEEEVLTLITTIARQLVRRELHHEPAHIISIIREGLAALPSVSVGVRVRLHPLDAEVVRELLQPDESGRAWDIEADPLMEQGGCQIISETAQIDGRLDTRLNRLVATMLEDERAARE
jgi:flagellar assembly protein FliH